MQARRKYGGAKCDDSGTLRLVEEASLPTAFVFAGGGSLGAIEAGMLRALIAHGERADFIVGASAGAINGAYFAGDPCPSGIDKLEAIWRGLKREHIFPLGWRNILQLILRRDHLVPSHGLRRLLEEYLPYRRLEDAKIPVHVVATDLATGAEVVLKRGPAIEAILASAAIPGVFPSVNLDGRELVDGGVCNNTPISTAVQLGADRIVVLPTGFACAVERIPTSAIGKALHSLNLLVARQLANDIERYCERVRLHVVPALCPLEVSAYDYTSCASLIERAAQSTLAWIARGGLASLAPSTHVLREHAH